MPSSSLTPRGDLHQDVEPAVLGDGVGDHLGGVRTGHVGLDDAGCAGRAGGGAADGHHLGAGVGQAVDHRGPEAAGATDDDGAAAGQRERAGVAGRRRDVRHGASVGSPAGRGSNL
nr:hypothetical protein [Desertihabitans brevis]